MTKLNTIRIIITCLLSAGLISACAYGIRTEPVIKEVSIGHIDNRTQEPKLADMLRISLTRQLQARGVHVRTHSGSANEISGVIKSITISPIATLKGVDIKFSVTIKNDFRLATAEGNPIPLNTPLSYMVTFGSDVPLDMVYAQREAAIRQAIDNLASDLAMAIAYNR